MKKNNTRQYRNGRRGISIIAGLFLLVLSVIFIIQHDKIEKLLLERTRSFGIRLERGQEQSVPLSVSNPTAYDINCKLEWNQGNHFKDPDLRTAKAFAWIFRDGGVR